MIRWVYAFIDRPIGRFPESCDFWTAVTGTRPSAPRGVHGEFVTLLPPGGDPYLKFQGVFDSGGAHPDLAVEDVPAAVQKARDLGATVLSAHATWTVLRSPGGQRFCVVTWHGERARPPVPVRPDGTRAELDQVCVGVGPAGYDAEVEFWAALTGFPVVPGRSPEFSLLAPPAALPVRILLQRLGGDRPASAHLDLACSDVAATRSWHQELGARLVARYSHWVTMEDPAGGVYCLSDRHPRTGRPDPTGS